MHAKNICISAQVIHMMPPIVQYPSIDVSCASVGNPLVRDRCHMMPDDDGMLTTMERNKIAARR